MNAEKDIVNIWLNQQGFFTVRDINAGQRVIDFLAMRPGGTIQHVEVNCSVSPSAMTKAEEAELMKKFTDTNVTETIQQHIEEYALEADEYQRVLVTTAKVDLKHAEVVSFQDVLAEVINKIDRQKYSDPVLRSLQLIKYNLIGSPADLAGVLNSADEYKALSAQAKQKMLKDLLTQETASRLFRKKENEELLLELLRSSTLRNPERLAESLSKVLTKRSASRFMNVLLKKDEIKEAAQEEIAKDKKLEEFFAVH